jgi:SET domain-containing protein 6
MHRSDPSAFPEAAGALLSKDQGSSSASPFLASVLMLMSEVAKGQGSKYANYIGSLPQSCDCLLSWDAKDKAELKGVGQTYTRR